MGPKSKDAYLIEEIHREAAIIELAVNLMVTAVCDRIMNRYRIKITSLCNR